jgi:hypothetical protein
MKNEEIIKQLHKDTDLPLDYLIQERELCKDSTLKLDCINFEHWNLHTIAYSRCNYYRNTFINMDKNICKDCKYYKTRLENK